MAKAYSLDLRVKAIENLRDGKLTQVEVANIFKVSLRTIKRWVKLYSNTGSVEPKVALITRPRKVDYKKAAQFIKKNPDKTLS